MGFCLLLVDAHRKLGKLCFLKLDWYKGHGAYLMHLHEALISVERYTAEPMKETLLLNLQLYHLPTRLDWSEGLSCRSCSLLATGIVLQEFLYF